MKVAIVCGSPSSEFLAPFNDESWEIWVLGNRLERYLDKRVTRVFEIHDNLLEHHDPGKYAEWLISHKFPMIVGEKFPIIKGNGIDAYPYDDIEKLFGSLYLTSSPAYMLGYAILMGATEIGLYGVDLSIGDHEYFWQRPCVEAWIGFAKGRGIKVYIPPVAHVGKSSYIEGRDWNGDTEVGVFSEDGFNSFADEYEKARDDLQKERQTLALKAASYEGASQILRRLAKTARAVEAQIDVKSLAETIVLR